MSTLADVVEYPSPPANWLCCEELSNLACHLLYYGVAPGTRKTYKSYQKSYEEFCYVNGVLPYPATDIILVEWISRRAFGSTQLGQGRLSADSIVQALSAVRSVHVDLNEDLSAFNTELLKRVVAGIRRVQAKKDTKKAAPLSIHQLEEITSPAPADFKAPYLRRRERIA